MWKNAKKRKLYPANWIQLEKKGKKIELKDENLQTVRSKQRLQDALQFIQMLAENYCYKYSDSNCNFAETSPSGDIRTSDVSNALFCFYY